MWEKKQQPSRRKNFTSKAVQDDRRTHAWTKNLQVKHRTIEVKIDQSKEIIKYKIFIINQLSSIKQSTINQSISSIFGPSSAVDAPLDPNPDENPPSPPVEAPGKPPGNPPDPDPADPPPPAPPERF